MSHVSNCDVCCVNCEILRAVAVDVPPCVSPLLAV